MYHPITLSFKQLLLKKNNKTKPDDNLNTASQKFQAKLSQQPPLHISKSSPPPLIKNTQEKTLHTKQVFDYQQSKEYQPTKNIIKQFKGQNTLVNAKNAYESNSKMFSRVKSVNVTLSQTPQLNKTLPKEPMEIKEANLRYKMVNTYIANDNYFKITA